MNNVTKCPHCNKVFFGNSQICPFCKKNIDDINNIYKNMFGEDNPFSQMFGGK